jgi:hypothetical protein
LIRFDIEKHLRAGFLAFGPHADQVGVLRCHAEGDVARFEQLFSPQAAAILQAEIEAADGRQFGYRRHVDGEDHRLLDAEEGHVGPLHQRLGAVFLVRPLVPALEADEGDRGILAAAEERKADDADHMRHFLLCQVMLLHGLQHFERALAGRARRQLDDAEEIALVLARAGSCPAA